MCQFQSQELCADSRAQALQTVATHLIATDLPSLSLQEAREGYRQLAAIK